MSMIRRATINDIPAIGRLWASLVIEENPGAHPDIERWCEIQKDLFNLKNYHVFVTEEDGQVVGFNNGLVLTDLETGDIYVDGGNFYVLPEYRKGSSGMKLHRNSLNMARVVNAKYLRRKVSANNKRMMERLNDSLGKTHFIKEYIVDEMIGGER
jgi:GNAT superfamily N-acetyltransferase